MNDGYPDTLRVGYQNVKLVFENSSMADSLGKYDTETAEIHVNMNHSKREIVNTLLHELLHAVFYTYGISGIITDNDKQEYVCNTMGNALTQVFLDNPKFLECVREGLNG